MKTCLLASILLCVCALAQAPDARASDPSALGWMMGSPPPAGKIIRFDDGSYMRFPQWRWSFSHWRELVPTVNVPRGASRVAVLPKAERRDLDNVHFMPMGGTRRMTWRESLDANYTDGIVVLHRGRIVYEYYAGALAAERQHIAFSVTKSFFGTIAAALIHEGKLDASAPVARYIPELKDSGFGGATVAQVLDMTTALKFTETYGESTTEFADYARAAGFIPRPPGYRGASSIYDYLAGIATQGEHGKAFTYRSINTDVAGWLIARVTGKPLVEVFRERIWSKLGAEDDAYLQVDAAGTLFAAGGLNTRLRDLARFGEMIRLKGRYNGRQIVPAAVIEDIARGGDRQKFIPAGYKTLPGWSYHNQWWVSHNEHGAFMGRGIHGQAIYIDPKAEMVIARYASHPLAGNVNLDPASLPAYHAVAKYLMSR
jgi:CubicO group peptidase (beta-lactamase class C family)